MRTSVAGAGGARRIRVLHTVTSLNYGGMERLIADLIRRTDPARFDLHLLVFRYAGRFAQGLEDHATLHHAKPLPSWTMMWPRPLADQIAAIAPDVVHSHSGVWWKSAFAAHLAAVPKVVHTEHGWVCSGSRIAALLQKTLCAHFTTDIVAVSSDLGEYLAQRVADRTSKVRVVLNGVDVDRFRPRPEDGFLRRELAIAPDAPLIVTIGRLESVKAQNVMLQAFARLCREWDGAPAPVLLLVGDGAERMGLMQLAEALGIASAVRFSGWRNDIEAVHAAAAIFTLTSKSEGTSIALLEAMSAGVCPVVTEVGGNSSVLGPMLAHRLVPAGDPAAVASGWAAALRDPDLRRRDAEAARARVVQRFNLATTVRQYETIYSSDAPCPTSAAPPSARSAH